MNYELVRVSRFLSLVLRHRPEMIGLSLDEQGWASIDDLVRLSQDSREPLTRELIDEVVRTNDKQRFRISDDGLRIRASQGHTIPVDLGLPARQPPEKLYHGTATRFLGSIRHQGLHPRKRRHVHLSSDRHTARQVGGRHGQAAVLTVLAGEMARAGHEFFLSDNGVWLTASVPPEFLQFEGAEQDAQ